MTKWRWMGVLTCLTAAVAIACASAPPPPEATPKPSEKEQPAAPTEEAAARQQPASKPSESESSKPPGPSFLDLVMGAKQTPYKFTYRMSGAGGGQTFSGKQTWYFKPPKSRMDFTTAAGGQASLTSMYILEDAVYLCTSLTGSTTCLKMPREQGMQQNQASVLQNQVQESPDQFDPTYQGTRAIAGQQAQCFGLNSKSAAQMEFSEMTFCYSTQGIPLLMQTKAQDFDMSMEATSFSTSVADSDFELPAKPVEIPASPDTETPLLRTKLVPKVGLEPTRGLPPAVFETAASAYSATSAGTHPWMDA